MNEHTTELIEKYGDDPTTGVGLFYQIGKKCAEEMNLIIDETKKGQKMPRQKTPKIINPKIYGIALKAFNDAFGDSIDYEDDKAKKLILAYAALLEIGAEYVKLRAFKRVHDHYFGDDAKKPDLNDYTKHKIKKPPRKRPPRKNLKKKEKPIPYSLTRKGKENGFSTK